MALFSSNTFLFIVCTLVWGSTWIGITFQVGETSLMFSVALRFTLAALIIGAWNIYRKRSFKIDKASHKLIFIAGVFLYCLDYSLLYAAQQYVVSALLAVFSSSVIYFNVVLRRLLLKKPIRLEVVIGATLGLIGIFLIFLPEFDKISLQQGAVFGVLFGAASFFCAAVGNVLSEKILEGKVTVSQMNFWAMTYGVSCSALVVLITGQSIQLPTTGSYYLALLYLAVFGSVIAFGAYMRLLKQIGSDKSAYVVLVYPIVALIISTVFEDYQWTLYSIAGVIIVLIGNAIAMGKLNRQLRIAEVSN